MIQKVFGTVTLIHGDCMTVMKDLPDKAFSLAVCDPNYGINFSSYERGSSGLKVKERYTKNGKKKWDSDIPDESYFLLLKYKTENQIIWGGNYFPYIWYNGCKHFIFWYKHNPVDNFSDGEMAWTSFDKPNKCFDYMYYGNINSDPARISPTQKPVALYEWILKNYAKPGDTILDSHAGSFSSAVACLKMGFTGTFIEIDADYFKAGSDRVEAAYEAMTLGFCKTKLNREGLSLF